MAGIAFSLEKFFALIPFFPANHIHMGYTAFKIFCLAVIFIEFLFTIST